MYWIVFILILITSGCGNNTILGEDENGDEPPLTLWMELPTNTDGVYEFEYPTNSPSSYTSVYYETEPMGRVFWFSPDSFTIVHLGIPITEPIINFSTYANGQTGLGKQLIYIYSPHINDTLNVIGCIENVCEETEFIVR